MSEVPPGYAHPDYARSVAPDGRTVQLSRSGGWLVERPTPDARHIDLSWPYPILCCGDWSGLEADLDDVERTRRFVTASVVTDPFGVFDESTLSRCFPDVWRRFKDHFVVDLRSSPVEAASNNHRRNARRALADLQIERAPSPESLLDDWALLYAELIERHEITGVQRFSREAFAIQIHIPGIDVFTASIDDDVVGIVLFYVQGDHAYYHLGAYSEQGYEHRASFGLFQEAIRAFGSDGLQWLSLGAGAGATSDGSDGLSRFKRGWATTTRPTWFGGRVLDRSAYSGLGTTIRNDVPPGYFPAHRYGEYG